MPGTRQLERLDENIGAVAVELTSDDLREIDSTSSKITVQAALYRENLEQMTGRSAAVTASRSQDYEQ